VWFLDIVPLISFLVRWLQFQNSSNLHTVVEQGHKVKNSFLMILTGIMATGAVIMLVLLTLFSRASYTTIVAAQSKDKPDARYSMLFERVFKDVPLSLASPCSALHSRCRTRSTTRPSS